MNLFGFGKSSEQKAEEYIESFTTDDGRPSALVRHYHVEETRDELARQGIYLSDAQTTEVVQGLRNKYGYGEIDEWNMPGYIDTEDDPEAQIARAEQIAEREGGQSSGGGFWGWLFG